MGAAARAATVHDKDTQCQRQPEGCVPATALGGVSHTQTPVQTPAASVTAPGRPCTRPAGHPPSDPQGWVVQQDADNVEQAGQQLQGEVEQPDPQACGWGQMGEAAVRAPGAAGTLHLGRCTWLSRPTLTRWLCVGGALPGRPPRGSMPSHLMDEVQSVPELLALGVGLGVGGANYRSMDQNPQATPLHPILHPRWPGSCWEGRWREPTEQRGGPHGAARGPCGLGGLSRGWPCLQEGCTPPGSWHLPPWKVARS